MKKALLMLTAFCLSVNGFTQTDSLSIKKENTLQNPLDQTVYSVGKRDQTVRDASAQVMVITRKEIRENGWQSLEDIFSQIPGMYMINDYIWFGSDNFGVRGFFTSGAFSSMHIMVNGVSQMEDWYNSFPLAKINVPAEAIDRIEVVRTPMATINGSFALLGSINIITNATDESVAEVYGGTNQAYKAFVRVADHDGELKYSINAGVRGSDGIDTRYGRMMSDRSAMESWGLPFNAMSGGQLADHRSYFGASLAYKSFYFESSQTATNRGVIDYYPGVGEGHLAEIQASNSVIGYRDMFNETLGLHAKAGYYTFRNRLDYGHNNSQAYTFNDIYSKAMDAEINLLFNPSEKLQTLFGTYFRQVNRTKLVVDSPNLSAEYNNLDAGQGRDESKYNWAFFADATYKISEKFAFSAGVRVEQTPSYKIDYSYGFDPAGGNTNFVIRKGTYNHDDILLMPKAALLYSIDNDNHVKLTYSMATVDPSIGENMDVVRFPDRPQLEHSNMHSVEASYTRVFSEAVNLNASVFFNSANNLISRTNAFENGEMQLFNTNSGELRTIGAELTLDVNPSPVFSSTLTLAYHDTKNLQNGYEGIAMEYAPQLLGYLTTTYRFLDEHTLSFSGHYVDAMDTYWALSNMSTNPQDGSRIGKKSPSYVMGNMNLRFNNLFNSGFYSYLYVSNVFNTKVVYPTTRSNDVFDEGTVGYGRNFNLGIGLKF